MAYMNSGIEMKTSQYDWRIIGFIILLLVAVCALVTIKLLFPDMTQEKLFSVLSSSSPAVNTASPQNVPSEKSAATASHPVIAVAEVPAKATPPAVEQVVKTETKAVNSVPAATDTHVTVETTETATTQHIAEEPRSASKAQIVCSAEDREAELCQ
jgi:hypothetical protein